MPCACASMQVSEQYIEFFLAAFWQTTQGTALVAFSLSVFFAELLLSVDCRELRDAFRILLAAAIGLFRDGS